MVWDCNGLAIWYKRLEKGKYKRPSRERASIELTARELDLLLDGVDCARIRWRPPLSLRTSPS